MLIYLNGLLLGLSLIISLGPQNLFLIRQGTRKNHAALSAVICFLSDMILISASIIGLNKILLNHPAFQNWMIWLGSIFLFYYAIKTLIGAVTTKGKNEKQAQPKYTKFQIILLALGFSLLNPQSIIDTFVIIGGGSSEFPEHQLLFLMGVISSSLLWFSFLFFTTFYFSNVLVQTKVGKCLELFSGSLMIVIAIKLLLTNS